MLLHTLCSIIWGFHAVCGYSCASFYCCFFYLSFSWRKRPIVLFAQLNLSIQVQFIWTSFYVPNLVIPFKTLKSKCFCIVMQRNISVISIFMMIVGRLYCNLYDKIFILICKLTNCLGNI